MSKRGRGDDKSKEEEVAHAIELIRGTPATPGEVEGLSLTPLERQVVALKASIPSHVILLVACGYRVKFYGRDSRVISRRTGIMCIPAQPFEYSSVPYVRVDHYVRRLVAMGYHVGFADQESAAVRAVEGVKSGVFQRSVSQLYSRGTLLPSERVVTNGGDSGAAGNGPSKGADNEGEEGGDGGEEDAGVEGMGQDWAGAPAHHGASAAETSELFLCFIEAPATQAEKATLHVVLVSFVTRRRADYHLTSALALEDVIQRFDIVEVVVLVHSSRVGAHPPRTIAEYLALLPETYATVLQHTLPLHLGPTANGEEDGKSVSVCGHMVRRADESGESLDKAIATYLVPYRLDRVYQSVCSDIRCANTAVAGEGSKAERAAAEEEPPSAHLTLPGSTLRALDVFYSSAGPHGSLLSLLNNALTPCGTRKVRAWLSAPLAERTAILDRQAAVTFLRDGSDDGQLADMLRECSRVGDVEATVGKLHAQRCGVLEYTRLLRLVRVAHTVAKDMLGSVQSGPAAPAALHRLLACVASDEVGEFVRLHKSEMDTTATTPLELFTSKGRRAADVPATIQEQLAAKERAIKALDAELERAREVLKLPGLEYRSIAGTSFLLDIPNGKVDRVPKDWTVLTRTKTNVRYHTPTIIEENVALCAANDRLVAAAALAWQEEQARLSSDTATLRVLNEVIESIASLDALHSLGVASARPGYVAPVFPEAADVSIVGGRHPVLDVLMNGGYVSCDVSLRAGGAWLLTGPNMGGKSAFMRMVGCFVVLAQLGCYVPAISASLPVFEGLFCRMGSSDSILEGSSTFLTEMEETSRILGAPRLERGLVLMDELGRGTSSFDGVAVAAATLEYLVSHRVTTIFVTHYSYLCDPYTGTPQQGSAEPTPLVECYYMGFREEEVAATTVDQVDVEAVEEEGTEEASKGPPQRRLVFTYKPTKGVTPSSFGVDIARMAGLPERVTAQAKILSAQEEKVQTQRMALPRIAHFLREKN